MNTPYSLNEVYLNNYLYFDEGPHKYTDTQGNEYLSVTTNIENYCPAFDKKYWLRKKAKERGISEKKLEAEWNAITKEACERGTRIHNGLEDGIKGSSMFKDAIKYLNEVKSGRCITVADIPSLTPKPLDIEEFKKATGNRYPEIYSVFQYYIDRGYTIYSEIAVFIPELLLSGTIDVLCVRPDRFVILDWKTNKDGLHFTSGFYRKDKTAKPVQITSDWCETHEFMLAPFANLENCNGNHYTMQLSTYAAMVEYILRIPCVGLGLCHIQTPFVKNNHGMPYRDKHGMYTIDKDGKEIVTWFHIKYIREQILAMFQDRRIKLNKEGRLNRQTEIQFD